MSKRKKKGSLLFSCIFWGLFFILITALFILNRKTIAHVFEKTQAKNVFLKQKPNTEKKDDSGIIAEIQVKKAPVEDMPPIADSKNTLPAEQHTVRTEEPALQISVEKSGKGMSASQIKKQEAEKPKTATRTAVMYLVSVDSDGKITRHSVKKDLPKSDSPMSDALTALFTSSAADRGLRSLIPPETRLRSAWVKDGVAFINVSDAFQYNQYGIDGYLAQLAQVVFTATEFPTVQAVQILIEGQKKDYLGAEGVWIGTPLSRGSF